MPYTTLYYTLYNPIQLYTTQANVPNTTSSPSTYPSTDRFLFLHFNARLLWQAGRPFMWSWYFIIQARQTLWFNYFIFLIQRPWHRSYYFPNSFGNTEDTKAEEYMHWNKGSLLSGCFQCTDSQIAVRSLESGFFWWFSLTKQEYVLEQFVPIVWVQTPCIA